MRPAPLEHSTGKLWAIGLVVGLYLFYIDMVMICALFQRISYIKSIKVKNNSLHSDFGLEAICPWFGFCMSSWFGVHMCYVYSKSLHTVKVVPPPPPEKRSFLTMFFMQLPLFQVLLCFHFRKKKLKTKLYSKVLVKVFYNQRNTW